VNPKLFVCFDEDKVPKAVCTQMWVGGGGIRKEST